MKKLLLQVLRKVFGRPGFSISFKDAVLSNGAEHLFRTRAYIYGNGLQNRTDTILDVGAASGETTLWFARNFPSHRVTGFEPLPESFDLARKLTRSCSSVNMINCALDERSGTSRLHVTGDRLASSLLAPGAHVEAGLKEALKVEKQQEVSTATLDELVDPSRKVLLLKLDTQGTELRILRGATRTIKQTALVLIEMNNNRRYAEAAQYYETDEWLRMHGFRLVDMYVIYRPNGEMAEYDALYRNTNL